MALCRDASGVAGSGSVEPHLPSLVPNLGWLLGFRLRHSSLPSKSGHPCPRPKFSIGMGSGGLSHLRATTMEKQQAESQHHPSGPLASARPPSAAARVTMLAISLSEACREGAAWQGAILEVEEEVGRLQSAWMDQDPGVGMEEGGRDWKVLGLEVAVASGSGERGYCGQGRGLVCAERRVRDSWGLREHRCLRGEEGTGLGETPGS